jgi:peptidoglycan hydrolase-like protein with peptidoglycan-binding domain
MLKRVWIPSPNYSSRYGSNIRLIVLHTAEGARTIESLGSFFQSTANQVSSHTGADDKPNTVGEYVKRGNKAWTAANANPYAVQIELCGFARWSNDEWRTQHGNMLQNAASWIAEESRILNIPIQKLTSAQAQSNGRGVCQHVNLGAWGGGHVDCGTGFPMDYVLELAKQQPQQTPPAKGPQPVVKPHGNMPQLNYVLSTKQNSRQPAVRVWQEQLRSHGHPKLQVDGVFGPQTEALTKDFQRGHGLTPDGIVGPNTWRKAWGQ